MLASLVACFFLMQLSCCSSLTVDDFYTDAAIMPTSVAPSSRNIDLPLTISNIKGGMEFDQCTLNKGKLQLVNNSNVFSIYVLTSPTTTYSSGQAALSISTDAGLRDRALSDIRLLFSIDDLKSYVISDQSGPAPLTLGVAALRLFAHHTDLTPCAAS